MKAIEVTGRIDSQGNLVLDEPIQGTTYPPIYSKSNREDIGANEIRDMIADFYSELD
jgi:hypothetical protein